MSTMYRIARAAGQVLERRRQATHPPRARPELGLSHQMPQHRPVERDEQAITAWRQEVWPQAKR
jgi:transposase